MKTNRILLLIRILFFGTLISCQENQVVPDNNSVNLNSKDSDVLSKIKKEGKYNFLPNLKSARRSSNGLDYVFYGVEWSVCCNQGVRTNSIQVKNTNYSSSLSNIVINIGIQDNMNLQSYSVPYGTLSFVGQSGIFKIYKWDIPYLSPNQTLFMNATTQFNNSSVEGLMGIYLPTDGGVSYCDKSLINLIRNEDGNCDNIPAGSPPYCRIRSNFPTKPKQDNIENFNSIFSQHCITVFTKNRNKVFKNPIKQKHTLIV